MKEQVLLAMKADCLERDLQNKMEQMQAKKKELEGILLVMGENLIIEDYLLLVKYTNKLKSEIEILTIEIEEVEQEQADIKSQLKEMECY